MIWPQPAGALNAGGPDYKGACYTTDLAKMEVEQCLGITLEVSPYYRLLVNTICKA